MREEVFPVQFKKIITVSVEDYNNNTPVDGYLPQKGVVINVYIDQNRMTEYVALGLFTLK